MGTYYTDFSGASTLTHTTFNTELAKLDGYVSALSDIADAMYTATVGGSYAAASGTTSNYHTPVVAGAKADEMTFNALFAGIDSEIGDVVTRLGSLNGNITTETNHHTAISSGANGTIDTFNDPVGELDAELTRVNAILDAIDAWTLANADYFVDSVAGDDGNAGTSSAAPFQTLSAVPLADDVTIALKRGSVFNEQIDASANTGVTVIAYGSGENPIVDASDIVAGIWVQDGTYTNCWTLSKTLELHTIKSWVNVWEDGAFLDNQTSIANCDAAAGSYYVDTHTGDGDTSVSITVHASDSGNPNSNGSVYKVAARLYSIYAGDGSAVIGVDCKNQTSENGSLRLDRSGYIINSTVSDGSKHNALVADSATVVNVAFEDAQHGTGGSMFVFNEDTPVSGGVDLKYCSFNYDALTADFNAIYGHSNTSGDFGPIAIDKCSFTNCNIGVNSGPDVASISVTNGLFTDCTVGASIEAEATIDNCTMTTSASAARHIRINEDVAVTVSNSTFSASGGINGGAIYTTNAVDLTIEDSTITFTTTTGSRRGIYVDNASADVTVNRCTFPDTNILHNFWLLNYGSYTGDYNEYGRANFNMGGTTYTVFATYQAAVAPQDANSTVI